MRKPVNRAAVRAVIRETLALRRWGAKRFDGSPIPGQAFGMDMYSLGCDSVREYFFSIALEGGTLQLELDTYSAGFGRFHAHGDDFDVDEWEAGKVVFQAPAGLSSRASFRELSRIGRSLVAGRTLRLADGSAITLASLREARA